MTLKQPAFRYFKDQQVTAYQDDQMWWKFYLIPDYVSIRKDVNGDPVFLLIKYAFSDEDRARNPNLPVGGGFMVFDTELSTAEESATAITKVLQSDVNDIWNQMKALADGAGQSVSGYSLNSWYYVPGHGDPSNPITTSLSVSDVLLGLDPAGPTAPPGNAPPKVILDTPTWTEGTFQITAPQSAALVSHTVGTGKLSLLGSNVAAANMDLTDAGATFMQETLLNPDGSGGSDLTPIQVTYDLKFWARVPPVHIMVSADSRSLYEAVKSVYHDYQDNGCSEDQMTHAQTQMSMAVQSGLVTVKVDAGTLPLTDDFVRQLTTSAQSFVTDQVKNAFFTKQAPPPSTTDDQTKDFVNKDEQIYYLNTTMDYTSVHIGYDETATTIQPWPAAPQGTLQSFFAGLTADAMKKFVRVVDLEDPFFQTLDLTVTAFASWDQHIDYVEVQLQYQGVDDNNQPELKTNAFTFTKDHTSDRWDPRLLNGSREYQYRWRVAFAGRDPADFPDWQTSTAPKLNIDVRDPGHLVIKVLAGNVNWADVTSQIQVELDYSDPDANVDDQSTTLILDQKATEQTYDRWIYAPRNKPLRYRPHFFLKTGQQVDGDWTDSHASQIPINEPPSIDKLLVNLLPVGNGWSNVAQVIIDLSYNDTTNQYMAEQTLQLKSLDEFRHWVVVLKDPTNRNFQYHYIASYKDGSEEEFPNPNQRANAQGDQTLPIKVRQVPELAVTFLPQLVDFTVTPLVEAMLHYDDGNGAGVHQEESLVFAKGDSQTWGPFPIQDTTRRSYRYQLTYHQSDVAIPQPEVTTDNDKVIVSALDVPQITCLVIPKLVDFTATPVVEVDVAYNDPANNISYEDTLVFTEAKSQQFQIRLAASSPKTYQITVTYYLADGSVQTRPPVTLDRNEIVVPRYVKGR